MYAQTGSRLSNVASLNKNRFKDIPMMYQSINGIDEAEMSTEQRRLEEDGKS